MRSVEGFSDFIQENIIAQIDKLFKEGIDELHRKTKQLIINLNLFNFASSDSEDSNKSPIELILENIALLAAASNQTDEDIFKKPLDGAIDFILALIKNKLN